MGKLNGKISIITGAGTGIGKGIAIEFAKENCSCADLANKMNAGEIDGYLLKPMNCPHHIRLYASTQHSYRDLPIRFAEFGSCHRYEASGTLHGLMRVRAFTQDDGHIFCTEEQIEAETKSFIELLSLIYSELGFLLNLKKSCNNLFESSSKIPPLVIV